jgi:hypothetical protein
MGKVSIGLCCLVGLVLGLVCSAYAGDSDNQQNGLFAAVGLNNLFQPQAAPEKKPEEKAVAKPEFSLGGFGQFMFKGDDNAPETFDLKRMRLYLSGKYDFLSFFVQAETEAVTHDLFATFIPGGKVESRRAVLLDCWADIACPQHKKEFNLKVGRFTVPFGWQVQTSPYELLTVNYSQIVTRLFGMDPALQTIPAPWWPTTDDWDNLRDQGFYFHGTCEPKIGGELKPTVGYVAGILNGESRAAQDTNDGKAGVLRLYVTPVEGITVGTSYYEGSRFYVNDPLGLAANGRQFSRRMNGVDWKFEFPGNKLEFLRNLLIQGEFIHAEINPADMGKRETTPSTHYKANHIDGWFVEIGYRLTEVCEKLQLVGKLDVLDLPNHTFNTGTGIWDKTSDTNVKKTYGFGANYYINNYSKLQLIWEHKDDEGKLDTAKDNDKIFAVLGLNF